MKKLLVKVEQLHILQQQVSFELVQGEYAAIIGPNASGKTTLAKMICGKIRTFLGTIKTCIPHGQMAFSDYSFEQSGFQYSDFYYQQRFNNSDETSLKTLEQMLPYNAKYEYIKEVYRYLIPGNLLKKKIIELSSGETRKIQIARQLIKHAKLYILDNPFTGLDTHTRKELERLFRIITNKYGKSVLLIINENPAHIAFDQIINLESNTPFREILKNARSLKKTKEFYFKNFMQMEGVYINTPFQNLLQNVNWTIEKGEKWLLQGPNGSGKSTLMSLMYGDNPKAYGMNIFLFDRRRGSGESIWDIKSNIGYISPEIQQFWKNDLTIRESLLSGFTDTVYLNRLLLENEKQNYRIVLGLIGLKHKEKAFFGKLSTGEKRMVMVGRALVKNPAVFILDEPFQGLDQNHIHHLTEILESLADRTRTILQIAHNHTEILPAIQHRAVIENHGLTIEKDYFSEAFD